MPPLSSFLSGIVALAIASRSCAADLSPADWPQSERQRVEKLESQSWSPREAQTVESGSGIVSATVSPIAACAGIQTLRQGGNAADAAITTALTQVTTQLGSVVSYAGVFTMLYYDAQDRRVYSMDAGYNSYLNETDPKSIPVSDLGALQANSSPKHSNGGDHGRKTLVPGFMAGVQAMHDRFGRLPFSDVFQPAIWYARKGVRISPALQSFFESRAKSLSRTTEGRRFIRQAGGEMPKAGDLFVQQELADTLTAISEQGSRYMYTGGWAENFVRIVQREGGKVTAEDLKRYEPVWSEPYKETLFGHTVYANGPPHCGAHALFAGLNLAEALKIDQQRPYWTDPQALQTLARIGQLVASAPVVDTNTAALLRSEGVDFSADAQLRKPYAESVAPLLDRIFPPSAENSPRHSNAIVVVDKQGNVAAVTHTINSVIWGDTGIVVDGIPIPDSAGFQQLTLANIEPGSRVPHGMIDAIVFDGDRATLAIASIGSSLASESIRVLVGLLGQRRDLATIMAAPPLLQPFDISGADKPMSQQPVPIPQGAYDANFIAELKSLGLNFTEVPAATASSLRGTLAAVAIDPQTGKRTAVDQPGVMVFNCAE